MVLDLTTIYLVATLVCALLGGMLLHFGRKESIPALTWWGAAYILGATAVALWALASGALEDRFVLMLDAIGLTACGLVWSAARVFHGKSPLLAALALGPATWIALVLLEPHEAASLRLWVGAAIIAIYAVLTAIELGTERRRAMKQRKLAMIVPLLHGVVLVLPIVMAEFSRTGDEPLHGNVWITVFAIQLVLYAVGTVFVIFMLVSERAVMAHKTAASLDPMTGLFNRRGFSEATGRMIEREARAGRAVSVMIFDIDHFKSINDRFGHPAGDELIKLFATIVTSTLRVTDLSGRIGGEEFAAVLPCGVDEAVIAAERVREAFQNCGIAVEEGPVDTTVSIGVAGGPPGTELEVLLAAADTALYQAKRSGRNRVVSAVEEPVSLESRRRTVALGKSSAAAPAMLGGAAA